MTKRSNWTLLAVALSVAACADSSNSSDPGKAAGDLNFLRLAATAPPLCADSVGAWFYKGPDADDQELALEFPESGNLANCPAGDTEDFLRLRLKKFTLAKLPDGTPIADGDSVFISVIWVGNDSILFTLKPSGLQFNSADPAELKIEYGEAGDDLNDDNQVDEEDSVIESKLDIWRQELPGDDFFKVGTAKIEEENEIEAKLNGFSRFAIAY